MDNENVKNIAFIDGQNLYLNTSKRRKDPWVVDMRRFRKYLRKKYDVCDAYYYLGYVRDDLRKLYSEIINSGFILRFREHNSEMISNKKGNVDTDIIFTVMKMLCKNEQFNKIVLVSGDGDYKMLVDFLIEEGRFQKILLPDHLFASSLYQFLGSEYFDYLDKKEIRNKINKVNKKGSLGSKPFGSLFV